MVEYKTYIGELVDDLDNDRLSLRLHKIKTTNNTKETYCSFTKCVEVRSIAKKSTKSQMVEKGLVELDKPFEKDMYVIIYCG